MNAYCQEHDIKSLLAHAPYTLNACAKDPGLREFAKNTFADDLQRLKYIPGCMYNFHPGSHVGQGVDTGAVGKSVCTDVLYCARNVEFLLNNQLGILVTKTFPIDEAVMTLFEDGEEKFNIPCGLTLHGNDSRFGKKKNQ